MNIMINLYQRISLNCQFTEERTFKEVTLWPSVTFIDIAWPLLTFSDCPQIHQLQIVYCSCLSRATIFMNFVPATLIVRTTSWKYFWDGFGLPFFLMLLDVVSAKCNLPTVIWNLVDPLWFWLRSTLTGTNSFLDRSAWLCSTLIWVLGTSLLTP